MSPQVKVFESKQQLIDAVAERAIAVLRELGGDRERIDVCLTGGSVGVGVLAAMKDHPAVAELPLNKLHWWWGDERFVPHDSPDRNALQAQEALLQHLDIPAGHIHALPASDEGFDLGEAAVVATTELANAEPFALTFLGVGPDAHVASLFPEHPGTRMSQHGVIAVEDSPKPPPERLSLTYAALNASERIWLVVAGEDKAGAVSAALGEFSPELAPVSAVQGTKETLLFADASAASRIET